MSGHDEIRALLGAYALDAVETDERPLIEEHLSVCDECRAELASLQRDVAALDRSAEPPDTLWTRIAERFRHRDSG